MRRCSLVPFAVWILSAGEVAAELKVLFIGNSFTFGYGSTTGVPDLFDRLAQAGGQDNPVTLMQAIGGADFEDHAGSSLTLAAINSEDWTHVVLQNHSVQPTHLSVGNGGSIPLHLTYGRELYNRVMENNPASRVVLYETWSRSDEHPLITGTSSNSSFASTAQFQSELRTNYRLLRDNLNNEFPDAPSVSVAPVGSAWELAGALLPLGNLGFNDLFLANETPYYGYHANDSGIYLAACVFYAKLYGSSPVGLHAHPLISSLNLNFGAVTPAYLEAKALEMVANGSDPVTIIGNPVSASVPEGHPLEFQVKVSGEPPFAVQWKKNGVPIAGATGMVLRIPAAWASLNGAQFTADVSNAVSQVTSAAATLSVTTAAPYSVFVDFGATASLTGNGPSPNDPVRHWNNVLPAVGTTSNGRLAGLVTSQNVTTLLDFQMLSRFNSSGETGAATTSVGLPQNATRDFLYGNTQVFNSLTNVFPRFRIEGLTPSWRHTLTFFASRTGVSDSRQTRYTVTGAESASVDLEVANNTAATAVLSNVASSQAGTLEVELSPGPLNVNSPHFTYLGSLQIDAVPGPSPPRAALVGTVSGSGSIVASPAQADYAVGEFIHLTAVPAPGWVFAGWSGDASGTANPLVVMIDADPAVTATFVQNAAPTVSVIANRVITEDTSTGAIAFMIGDAETPTSLLMLNKYSSNPALVAPSGLVLGGSGTNRTINVTPLPNAYGTTTITISVSDGELSTQSTFLLTVTPQDDDSPVADADLFTIDEDTTLEDDVSLNDTIGVDGGTFAAVTTPVHGDLTLDPDGSFIYDPDADFEGVDSFMYRITDSDGDTSDATVTITVLPVNEAPVAQDAPFAVAENSPPATVVGNVTASDPDAGQTLAFAITAGNEGGAFTINPGNGEITVAGALDFETQTQRVLTVTVADDHVPALAATATITISITGVNEAPVAQDAPFAVAENSLPATVVGNVTAIDPDAGQTLAFAITAGNEGGAFAINPGSGEITVAGALDYETQPQHVLTVTVTDDQVPGLAATATITISITGVNEAPVAQDAPFAVAENSLPAAVVGNVTAIDPDAGQTLAFAITAGNEGGAFAINPGSGEITVAGALDYETQPQHVLTVTVTDDQVPALAATATITINITGVNEAPVAQDAPFAVAENSLPAAVVGNVTAIDPDAGQTLAFAITAGNEGGAFAINPGSGEITVAAALDFETQPQHVLTVTVTDDQVPALAATATITINITGVNEAPVAQDAPFAVAENSPPATVVGNVTAIDPDAGQTLAFAITAGNEGGAFAINPGTGEITVAGVLDFEAQPQHVLTVTVTDDQVPALVATATITINITGVNEAPVAQDAPFAVAENSPPAAVVGNVTAIDPDAGQTLAFAITAGNEGGAFAINPLTGEITVAGALDFETQPQHVLTVTVTDDQMPALVATATITINITDVNDGFADWLAEFGISNSSPGVDSDQGSISNAVEYVIGGDPVNRNDTDRLPSACLADPDGNISSPEYLLFSYRRTDRSNHDPLATIGVDWSSNLSIWDNAAVAPGVLTFVDDDHFGAGIDRVRVYLPLALSPSGLLFARLAVFINDTQ